MITLDFRQNDNWGSVSNLRLEFETTEKLVIPTIGSLVHIPHFGSATVKNIQYGYSKHDIDIMVFIDYA